jgi:hypothetical protein
VEDDRLIARRTVASISGATFSEPELASLPISQKSLIARPLSANLI